MTTTTTTPDTVTFILTHAAYSALGLDEDGMLENRSLERALSFKVLSRGVRYTLPLDAARDLYRALDSSHMIEPESIALVGLGEYNAACALHRTVGRLVGEAEARAEAREVQARLEAAEEAIDAIESAETEGQEASAIQRLALVVSRGAFISSALESRAMAVLDGLCPSCPLPEVVAALRVALAYGDLTGLEGCGFPVSR